MGKPSDYNDTITDTICERIAEGRSLRSIAQDEDMPHESTIYRWLFKHKEFSEKYARAREAQADVYAEEIIEIADNSTDDVIFLTSDDDSGDGAKPAIKHSTIARARLQIDTRKWLAGKLRPKKYGDSTQVKHADADGNKLSFSGILNDINGGSSGLPGAESEAGE